MLRVFSHWCSQRKIGLFFAEELLLAVGCLVGAFAAAGFGLDTSFTGHAWAAVVTLFFVFAIQGGLYLTDLYDLHVASADRRKGVRLLRALGVVVLAAAALTFLVPADLPKGGVIGAAVGAVGAILFARMGFPVLVGTPTRVLIVGSGARARELAGAIAKAEDLFEVAGFVGDGFGEVPAAKILTGEVDQLAKDLHADLVVVAREERRGTPVEGLLKCRTSGLQVLDAPAFYERALRRLPVASLRAGDLAFSEGFERSPVNLFVIRALDLAAAIGLTLVASPIFLLAAAMVRFDSKGPIFYSQERVGKDGKVFKLTKFRTMRPDAEKDGAKWAVVGDNRVTRVGRILRKSRMDELPQVFAVLKGDMSFVGPRPERPVFVEQLKQQIPFYGLREIAKPGITGWAQIRYPYGASVEDARAKLEYDLYYLKNRSLFLDLSVIFHTVRHVLFGRGAR